MHPGQVQAWSPRGGTGAGQARPGGRVGRRDGQEERRHEGPISARRHEGPLLARREPRRPRLGPGTKAPVSAQRHARPISRASSVRRPRGEKAKREGPGSLPPCACSLTQAKKRFCFVFPSQLGADFQEDFRPGCICVRRASSALNRQPRSHRRRKPGGTCAGRALRALIGPSSISVFPLLAITHRMILPTMRLSLASNGKLAG